MSALRHMTKHPTISLVDSCTSLNQLKQIHTQLLINNHLNDSLLSGQFIASIALNHPTSLGYSHQLFDQYPNPTIFTINSMIRAHSRSPFPHRSFYYYHRILVSNSLSADNYTFTFLVRTCTEMTLHNTGPAVHGSALKHGFESDPHVQSGLIHMYSQLGFLGMCQRMFFEIPDPDLVTKTTMVTACARLGQVDFARKLFDEMPVRDRIAWNAMIAGYAQCGNSREALNLFYFMQRDGVKIDEAALVSVLSACSQLGALDQGRWVHGYIERNRIRVTVTIGTGLIDMYAKCGNMDKAMEVFWGMRDRNVYTWSSAMNGLAMNGAGRECLELFDLMKQECVLPNEVTFVSLLRGCSAVGLVEEGCKHFESMKKVYWLKPSLEHYGCMVDLYGRAGRLDDAVEFINNMPIEPHAGAWGALLSACKTHGHMKLGELTSRKLVELETKNHGAYVLLSNIYADYKNWDGVTDVRQLMKNKGVGKVPGCSAMEVDGVVHEFFAGDKSHPRYNDIEVMLDEIVRRLTLSGYAANTNSVLFDIEDEEKEDSLGGHSEKVTIAFGLISLPEGVAIRTVKNLRVCGDCHDVTKIISRVLDREIIVRDRNRFHHFKDGECSCRGFW